MSKNTALAELMNYITIDTTSGNQFQMSGSIKQTSVTSSLVKTSSTGVFVAAVAGTDYQAAITGTGFVKSTAGVISYDTNTYLTSNQSISLSGDVSGSGATSIAVTLATVNSNVGSFGSASAIPVITVDAKGRITAVSTSAVSIVSTLSGLSDVTITTASNAQLLQYNSTSSKWVNWTPNYASTSYVDTAVANLVASAPSTLDTLNELATALGNDPNFATTVTNSIASKQAQLNGTGFVKVSGTTVSYDNSTYYLASNPSGYTTNTGTVTSVAALTLGTTGTDLSSSVATGTTTPVITLNVPTASASNRGVLSSTDWSTFNSKQAAISLTTTGSSGAATFSSNTLNIPNYTLAGLGGQASSTNLTSLSGLTYASTSFVKMTAAGTFALDTNTYYLASNPSGYTTNTGTVTSVAALTLGTTGTDLSSSVATGTTTPVITLNVPTASATNRGALSSTDWSTFNNKQAAISLTTTGSSGAATFSSNTLNIPNYTLAGLGGQASSTNLTSLAGLTYASTSFVKMTAAGTFALDTNTYYLSSNPSGYITSSGSISGNAATATTATNWGTYGGVPAAGTSFGTANTIGRSDANGYTFFNYINSNTANSENPTVSQVIVTNGTDNYYRKSSIASFTSAVQSNAGGTWNIAISGNAGSASSVAWTNVSGRPTALSAFTNDTNFVASGANVTFGEIYSNNWFRSNNSGTGLYNQATTLHLSSTLTNYWDVSNTNNATTGVVGMRFYAGGHLNTLRGYIYSDASGFGILNNQGGWSVLCNQGASYGGSLSGAWSAASFNTSGALTQGGNQVLHAGNYTSYSPSLTGGSASGTWNIAISGNAATASSAVTLSTTRSNWSSNGTISAAVGQLSWKNYGNGHTIFDASASTSPDGTSVNNTNSTYAWSATYPTLMGWNGSATYGVRVDTSRYSESTGSVAWTNVSGRPTAVSSFTNDSGYITSSGRAYPRRSDGGDLNFYWSGQSGQPTWLWGGTDGTNMYVYNPSNFSVNYATTAGSAPAAGGTSSAVTISYNNDSNASYQMLWGSGNSVYGTGGIYCNPYTDTIYATQFIENSSIRFKENVISLEGSLDKVTKIRGVQYNKIGTNYTQIGVIAEEIKDIVPDVVNYSPDGEVEGVAYARLTALLVEAIKEQQIQINQLKETLNNK